MGLFDKIKDLVNVPDDDEYVEQDDFQDYDEFDEFEEEPKRKPAQKPITPPKKEKSTRASYGDFADKYSSGSSQSHSADSTDKNNKVVSIHTTTQVQVVIVQPEKTKDVTAIADHLKKQRTVVLNLETTPKDEARRILDFLMGVAYANDGKIKRVAASTFIVIPPNVNIMGDLLDELENNGVFF